MVFCVSVFFLVIIWFMGVVNEFILFLGDLGLLFNEGIFLSDKNLFEF